MKSEDMPLCEKYRPTSLDLVLGQNHITDVLKEKDKLNHMTFIGPAGTGKTTVAHILADMHGLPIEETNASDDRGIGMIRDKVKKIASRTNRKVILLDESDQLCLTADTMILRGPKTHRWVSKLSDLKIGYRIAIPSVNPDTLEIEDDFGRLVDSGNADFYRMELENGAHIDASLDHPFFKIKDSKLVEVKLKDLSIGDTIVEVDEKLFNHCETCGKSTLNERYCSTKCQDKGHSVEMSGVGNPMFGRKRLDISGDKNPMHRPEVIAKFMGENNPNYGGSFHGDMFWDIATPEQIAKLKSIISEVNSKPFSERFGDRELEERAKRNPNSDIVRIKTNMWIKEILVGEHIHCEDCKRIVKTHGRDRDSIYIHHMDGNPKNHVPENLKFVCPKCHNMIEHDSKERFLEKGWKITHGNNWNEGMSGKEYLSHFKDGRVSNQYIKGREMKNDVHNGIKIIAIDHIGIKKAWNICMERNKNFVLSNGVVTHNTSDAQAALRRIIEKSPSIFILTGNYGYKIIGPIKSRCPVYKFKPLTEKQILGQIIHICKSENIDIEKSEETKEAIKTLVSNSDGDMRKAINILEKVVAKGKITRASVLSLLKPNHAAESLQSALDGDLETAQRLLENDFKDRNFDADDMIKDIYECIKDVPGDDNRARLYYKLSQTASACKESSKPISPLIHLIGFISYAWLIPHFPRSCPLKNGDIHD